MSSLPQVEYTVESYNTGQAYGYLRIEKVTTLYSRIYAAFQHQNFSPSGHLLAKRSAIRMSPMSRPPIVMVASRRLLLVLS